MYKDTDSLEFFDFDDFSKHGFTYPDGTGLMQLLRYDNLYIRLLHPNGTLTKFTVPTSGFLVLVLAAKINRHNPIS